MNHNLLILERDSILRLFRKIHHNLILSFLKKLNKKKKNCFLK